MSRICENERSLPQLVHLFIIPTNSLTRNHQVAKCIGGMEFIICMTTVQYKHICAIGGTHLTFHVEK